MRKRDNQKSRVYAWQRVVIKHDDHYVGHFDTVDECAEFAEPIWRAERGRYGLAKHAAPLFGRPHRGQRSALAHSDHRITLPRWARNPFVILHEMAHRLTPKDESHGPRFVGVLIGLCARHLGMDRDYLLQAAYDCGIKVHERAIGRTPTYGWHRKIADVIEREGPLTVMQLAIELEVSWRVVHGGALRLLRNGTHRWLRGKLVIVELAP